MLLLCCKAVVLNQRGNYALKVVFGKCLETFLLVVTEMGRTSGIQWEEARDAAKYLIMHRISPHIKIIWPKYQEC